MRTMASVGCLITGSGTSSTRTSPAPYISVARMDPSQRRCTPSNQWLLFRVMTEPPKTRLVRLAWRAWISDRGP